MSITHPQGTHLQISHRIAALLVISLLVCFSASASADDDWAWQNPFMSPNPGNHIHNDSYLTDSYAYPGPEFPQDYTIDLAGFVVFRDPDSGRLTATILAECAAQAFDAEGDIQTICTDLPNPQTGTEVRRVVTIDTVGANWIVGVAGARMPINLRNMFVNDHFPSPVRAGADSAWQTTFNTMQEYYPVISATCTVDLINKEGWGACVAPAIEKDTCGGLDSCDRQDPRSPIGAPGTASAAQ